jgi:peptidoglycan-N-acetylmuramic acid deacetylase
VVIDDINTFDTNGVYYGVGNSYDSETGRPNLAFYELKYGQYKADFIQPDSSYVWLTFNEIYEYGNTAYILDVLKEKEVSAVFFVTMSYAQNNPDLVKRMIEEGHVIGSYTTNGVDVPNLSVNSLTSELDTLYNYVYETYGYEMYLFRTPSGYFSEQALAVAQNHGYRTVFWSFAYSDWNVNAQPEVDTALQNALAKVHGGAIYQLSASSTTNKMMLNDLIDGIRERDYEFAVYQKN